MSNLKKVVADLKQIADPAFKEKQAYFGIDTSNCLGLRMPQVRAYAKTIGTHHSLALQLWDTQIHECKLLATMLADENLFTEQDIDKWIFDFNSWDICDQACANLFYKLPYIQNKIVQYHNAEPEYVKRFSFAMIAVGATHWKKIEDKNFLIYFPIIQTQAWDKRNFVKKAINWAIRQMGKRSIFLNHKALECCDALLLQPHPAAHWIAKDAIKELMSSAVQMRLEIIEKIKKENALLKTKTFKN